MVRAEPLFSDDYLLSLWVAELAEYRASGENEALRARLARWVDRDLSQTETQLQGQFVTTFFGSTWGYWGTGERPKDEGYCLNAQFGVVGAGQTGGKGAADVALGWWGLEGVAPVGVTFEALLPDGTLAALTYSWIESDGTVTLYSGLLPDRRATGEIPGIARSESIDVQTIRRVASGELPVPVLPPLD